eukprot:1850389-Rhodomonas_salina.8
MTAPPQAVRLEYGLGGCVDGRNQMLTLRLKEARARLGLPDGGEVEVREGEGGGVRAKLKAWTDLHGWHDLQDRLMGRGMDAWTVSVDVVWFLVRMDVCVRGPWLWNAACGVRAGNAGGGRCGGRDCVCVEDVG